MTTVTLQLSEEEDALLREIAARKETTIEDAVREAIGQFLERERKRIFRETADYILQKNAELYRRLAQGPPAPQLPEE